MKSYLYAPPLDPNPRWRQPFFCTTCDYGFATDYEPDLAEHDIDHSRMLETVAWTGPLLGRQQRREIYYRAHAVLNSDAPLDHRVAAAEELLEAQRHLRLRRAANNENLGRRCSHKDFISAANLEGIFDQDVAAALRARYGRITWPEIRWDRWEYRD
jgi:hypothetical protein